MFTGANIRGQVYELSGPRSLTFAEAVAEIAAATGRALRLEPIPMPAWTAELARQDVSAEVRSSRTTHSKGRLGGSGFWTSSRAAAGLNVRAQPATASPVIASIDETGTRVNIVCFTRGEPVHGDTVWYRISTPSRGYVTNYFVRTNSNILATTPMC